MEMAVEIVREVSEGERGDAVDRSLRRQIMRNLGVWLRERQITQDFAAAQLHLHRGHLSNLIRGKHVASDEICKATKCLMDFGDGVSPRAPEKPLDVTVPLPPSVVKKPTVRYRRALLPEEITAVGQIVQVMIQKQPKMTVDELVAVTRAAAEGFRSDH
jgi:predicted XRE-type DNA-binding protein